jgi:cytochrome c oxidase cbb3-type subunit III
MNNNEENKVQVFDDEKALLLNHNYDGIHELNHPLPMWWVVVFVGTVIFSIPYYFYYTHMNGPSLKDELNAEMKVINERQAAFAAKKGTFNMDEYNAIIADETHTKGAAKLYRRKCQSCHGAEGEGGIGPNLADMFWINGDGSIPEVYKIIDQGVTDKGMPAWGAELGKENVMALVDYIRKFQGTNPANAKGPQGEKYE